jgi:hypothetical protein
MPVTVLVHISGEDPVVGEMEELPSPQDSAIIVHSPRRRDGKDVPYLQGNVNTVMWPMHRVNFIEMIPSLEEERLIGRVRE